MTGIRVVPIDENVAKEVRTTMLAPDYGHPAWSEVPDGASPCRLCLTMIKPGEERLIAFTYDAFRAQEDMPLPGPVFIHERDCAPYAAGEHFPEAFRAHALVLDAYSRGRVLRFEKRVEGANADAELTGLFARAEIDYVHVRSASAGCYLFTVRAA
jgi:Protein of unknown function (DUF1203)